MSKPNRNRHRQKQVVKQKPELQPGQCIAHVVQARGENIYEVETANGQVNLYQLPKRLRFVAFVRRGTFVFVRDDNTRRDGKVRGDIEVVIIDEYLNDMRKDPSWPARFARSVDAEKPPSSSTAQGFTEKRIDDRNEFGVEEVEDDDDWYFGKGNPNREKYHCVLQDGDGDSSSDD